MRDPTETHSRYLNKYDNGNVAIANVVVVDVRWQQAWDFFRQMQIWYIHIGEQEVQEVSA